MLVEKLVKAVQQRSPLEQSREHVRSLQELHAELSHRLRFLSPCSQLDSIQVVVHSMYVWQQLCSRFWNF